MKIPASLMLLSVLATGCEFNKSGPDERTNFGEQLPEMMETQNLSEEATEISTQEDEFKDLISLPELKVGALKQWAKSTSQLLTDFLTLRGERLSTTAKQEIQNTLLQLKQVQLELASKGDEESIPFEIQAGIRSLLGQTGRPDFKKIGQFVQTLSTLESLEAKSKIYFSGESDVPIEEIELWMSESRKQIEILEIQFSGQLTPNLKMQIGEQKKLIAQIESGLVDLKSKGVQVLTGKQIKTLKKVVDAKADLKQFIDSLQKVELTEENFRAIFMSKEFSLQELLDWALNSRQTLSDFKTQWAFSLEPEESKKIGDQVSNIDNIAPYISFALNKGIGADQDLIKHIARVVSVFGPINWPQIAELVENTYGILAPSSSINFESLPIENGFYLIEEEKILVTSSLIRHIPHFERVKKFEEKLQAQTGFVMVDMLIRGEEIQNLGPVKKAFAFNGYKSVLKQTRSEIKDLPEKEKREFTKDFILYQSDLEELKSLSEIQQNERLREGLQGSRCLSFFLLDQEEMLEAEDCPIM